MQNAAYIPYMDGIPESRMPYFVYSSYFATAPFLGIEGCAPTANFAWKTAIIAGPVYKAFPILYVWIEQ